MSNTFRKIRKAEKESFKVPKSVQNAIPIKKIYEDGIFRVGNNFTKSYKFSDINYRVASKNDQLQMFMKYSDLLNSLPVGCVTKITINNRTLNQKDFSENILIDKKSDSLDCFRDEYNNMLVSKSQESTNNMVQEKYITISTSSHKNILDARVFFNRISSELTKHFTKLSSRLEPLHCEERLRVLHDFYRLGEEEYFHFDLKHTMKCGHDFKDSICPEVMEFNKDYIKIGKKYCRTLYIREYASFIKDELITELTDMHRNLMLSIDILPIPTDESVKIIQNLILGAETDKARFTKKQSENGNFTADIPYDLEQRSKELHEFMDDLTARDQRMIFATINMTIACDSLEQLEQDTESIKSIARKYLCDFSSLTYQQLDGLYTAMPFGVHKLPYKWRTLTTEATAVFIPFATQEIRDKNGIYYGINYISKNLIIADRQILMNSNGFFLGVSGSGKSFKAKEEMVSLMLRDDVDIIVLDPESEYGDLFRAMGGEVIKVSAGSNNHINALDMSSEYDDENPIALKSEFISSLCEQQLGGNMVTGYHKSVLDRCIGNVYEKFILDGFKGTPPTLKDLRAELLRQTESEAHALALALEIFTEGSLNTFAQQTNVNTKSQYIVYDIKDLGKQLRTIGMLVVLDSIYNRIAENRKKGRYTYLYIDEIYLLFKNEYSSNFLFELWKRVRKYGACASGITQNVNDLLQSENAKAMLANSEFLILMNQAPTDRIELAKLLNISETQLSHVTDNANTGQGLLKLGSAIVPFDDSFPTHTQLYKLMSTKFLEK